MKVNNSPKHFLLFNYMVMRMYASADPILYRTVSKRSDDSRECIYFPPKWFNTKHVLITKKGDITIIIPAEKVAKKIDEELEVEVVVKNKRR